MMHAFYQKRNNESYVSYKFLSNHMIVKLVIEGCIDIEVPNWASQECRSKMVATGPQ